MQPRPVEEDRTIVLPDVPAAAAVRVDDDAPPHPSPRGGRRTPLAVLVAADAAMVATAWVLALLAPLARPEFGGTAEAVRMALICTCVAVLGASRREALRIGAIRAIEVQRIVRSSVLSAAAVVLVQLAFGGPVPYAHVLAGCLLACILLNAGRGYVRWWLAVNRASGRLLEPSLLIGGSADALHVLRIIDEHPEQGMRVVGVVADDVVEPGLRSRHVGPVSRAVPVAETLGASHAVLIPGTMSSVQLNRIARDLLAEGVEVHLWTGLSGLHHTRMRRTALARQPFFSLEPAAPGRLAMAAKRAIDLVLASVLLVASLPLLLAAASAIRATSAGPVLFRQQRVGRHGTHFELLKLRTMVVDAERVRDQLAAGNDRVDGPLFKLATDPRVTPVGRILRALSVDELPQLVNVLRGEMSLVGPRPALPEEVDAFDEDLRRRTAMPPGISGLWQIEARDNPHFGAYRRLDLFYIENWSVWLDVGIIVATAGLVVLRGLAALRPRRRAVAQSAVVGG